MASFKNAFSKNAFERDIYRAIYSGNVDKLHDIIDSFKPKYLIPWAESQQLLTAAIECKRLEIAKILLTKGCDIGDTITLIFQALGSGDVELVKLLLDKDPQSLHKRLAGDTLLHVAVCEEIVSMVKLLIAHGANVNLADSNGRFPLNVAARRGNVVILKLLLESGADIESQCLCKAKTSLLYAINNYNSVRYKTVVKELLDAGANVNSRDVVGRTPLYMACLFKSTDLIPLLLNAGADVNINDNDGMVPCDAFFEKKLSCCQYIYRCIPFPLVQHLILLKEASLYLHERNQSILDIIICSYCHDITVDYNVVSPSSSMIDNVFEMCVKEIDLMKKVKAVNGSVLYDTLKKLDNFSLYSVTKSEIQLLKLVILQNKFPLYTVVLKTHLKYAELRSGLVAQAQDCLASLIDLSRLQIPFLPEELRVHIISNLENKDLKLFIKRVLIVRKESEVILKNK